MRIELPERKTLVFESTIPIRWGDMDAMGHVNNTIYFRYLEVLRIDWMESIQAVPNPAGEGPVIVNAFCNFHRQLEYPGAVRAQMFVSGIGRTSFETWVVMRRADDPDTVYATGGATTVWVNFPAKKSAPLPEALVQHLRTLGV